MSEPTAILLVAHGSPDPDWRQPLDALVERLGARVPACTVTVAYLGSIAPSVAEAVAQLVAAGHRDVLVLAAFLSPGGRHIKRDVPQLVAEQAAAHPGLRLRLRPGALGAEPEVVEAMAQAAARALRYAPTNADESTS